jgi:hypothetical protein
MDSDPITGGEQVADDALQLAAKLNAQANTPAMQQAAEAALTEQQREAVQACLAALADHPAAGPALDELRKLIAS